MLENRFNVVLENKINQEEVFEWLKENISSKWEYLTPMKRGMHIWKRSDQEIMRSTIYDYHLFCFDNKIDAISFKLRWI